MRYREILKIKITLVSAKDLSIGPVSRSIVAALMSYDLLLELHRNADLSAAGIDSAIERESRRERLGHGWRRGAARRVRGSPTGERCERSARVYEEGSLFHFHRLLHRAERRGFSLVAVSASEAAPVPVAAVPVVALLCRSQLSSTHTPACFTPSSRHDGGDTRFMHARVHARTAHAHEGRVRAAGTHARGPTTTTKKNHVESYRDDRRNPVK